MSETLGACARRLIAAPLQVPDAIPRLGRSLWLYIRLLAVVNSSGHVCRTLASLANDLAVPPSTIEAWLARLSEVGLVRVMSPTPYLVMKLSFWPTSGALTLAERPESMPKIAPLHREVPVSSSKLLQDASAAAENTLQAGREDGGAGEGDETLLTEVLRTLGESDAALYRSLIATLPRSVVVRALVRLRATPPSRIRKSRIALFRYLLTKFANESHVASQPHHP